MKLTELISKELKALDEYGDIDVCTPCVEESIDGMLSLAEVAKTRAFREPGIPADHWNAEDRRIVFVIG